MILGSAYLMWLNRIVLNRSFLSYDKSMLQELMEIMILSAMQGMSEFLPISSSAHLMLVSNLYNLKTSSLLIDISLHLGSLFAMIFYFKSDLVDMKNNKKLMQLIMIGSIPLMIFGFMLYKTEFIYLISNVKVMAFTTLFFAMILFFSDQSKFNKTMSADLNFKTILFIGLFQILALMPGVSSAGITLTAASFLEFNSVDSSKISFLLSMPALAGASFLGLKDVLGKPLEMNYLIFVAVILSFLFSYMTMKFFLNYINKFSLNLFVVYSVLISLMLFLMMYN